MKIIESEIKFISWIGKDLGIHLQIQILVVWEVLKMQMVGDYNMEIVFIIEQME